MLPDASDRLKWTYGVSAFQQWCIQRNQSILYSSSTTTFEGQSTLTNQYLIKSDLLSYTSGDELEQVMSICIREIRRPTGEEYLAESIYYLCLGMFNKINFFLNKFSFGIIKVYNFI